MYVTVYEPESLWVSVRMYPLDGAVTIEVLYCFPVHPVHLKARLLGQIAGLHYGARPVDVGETQNMADLMNCHLIEGKMKIEWMSWKLTSDHSVKTVCLLWEGWSHCQCWDQWSVRRHQSVYHPGTKRAQTLDPCHQTSDCNPDAFLWKTDLFKSIQSFKIQAHFIRFFFSRTVQSNAHYSIINMIINIIIKFIKLIRKCRNR